MSKQNETVKTIVVAGLLCFVCSILVSGVVVALRPMQAKNAEIDMKKNILMSAGMLQKGDDVEKVFATLETLIVDLDSGEVVDSVNAEEYDQVAAVKDPDYAVKIPTDKNVGGLGTRSKYAKVYVRKNESGDVETVILNQWGKGLWSTMYGFIALGSDYNTIKGFGYYSQGETPGLGGEVDNPKWKAQWVGKKIYNEDGEVAFKVAKGQGTNEMQVDGLSGATITSNGVTSSIKYWFGENGYKPFIENLKSGGLQ